MSTQSLARHAEAIRLGEHLLLGRGEEKTGGRFKQALLADAYEALIAAVYLDGGLTAAAAFLERELSPAIAAARQDVVGLDYKSALQERLQASGARCRNIAWRRRRVRTTASSSQSRSSSEGKCSAARWEARRKRSRKRRGSHYFNFKSAN